MTRIKALQMGVTLRGDRNQCAGCGELFNSTHAFEKHRVGDHEGGQRRCLTPAEMEDKGMFIGADRFWRGSAMPARFEEQA
jgi:hypothetical protein